MVGYTLSYDGNKVISNDLDIPPKIYIDNLC